MATIPHVTLVLMGHIGNGKSATGNTILGKKVFESRRSSLGITKSSQLQTCVRKDGQVVSVIDMPGMFNFSGEKEYIVREIMKCIDFESEGIHAVLLVFSLKTRFTKEEEATIQTLQNSFGPKIVDYAIVVLTGGGVLDEDDDNNSYSLEDYLSNMCPVALKDILAACKNRCVVFDNKTKSELKKDEQVSKLLGLVTEMIAKNGGQPYKPGFISKLKVEKEFDEVKSKLEKEFDELKRKLKRSSTQELHNDPLEEELNEDSEQIERKWEELNKRRLDEACRKLEERLHEIERRYTDEIEKLTEELRIVLQMPLIKRCHIL